MLTGRREGKEEREGGGGGGGVEESAGSKAARNRLPPDWIIFAFSTPAFA